MRIRSRNMDDKTINEIMSILDGWTGNLSWELLIEEIFTRLSVRYTRQALNNYDRIKQAFSLRKKLISTEFGNRSKPLSPELEHVQQRIQRLETENQRLRMENSNLLEQFVRWAYNASTRGFDEQFLNQSLVKINRDPTMTNVTAIADRRIKP